MRVNLNREEIALAMELRSEGIHWHHIATGLGVTPKTIRKYVRQAEQCGAGETPTGLCSRVRTAYVQERAAAILAADTPAPTGHGGESCESMA